jgi:hypothetical protein
MNLSQRLHKYVKLPTIGVSLDNIGPSTDLGTLSRRALAVKNANRRIDLRKLNRGLVTKQ